MDMVILGMYPEAAVSFVKANKDKFKKGAIITDTSGTKSEICPALTRLAKENGFTFVGVHPMAGKEKNGFGVSDSDLFKGASCIIVPCEADDEAVKAVSDFNLFLRLWQYKADNSSGARQNDSLYKPSSPCSGLCLCSIPQLYKSQRIFSR
jgi:prephenate dehydrogenase